MFNDLLENSVNKQEIILLLLIGKVYGWRVVVKVSTLRVKVISVLRTLLV